jgi:hypothetical protein
MQRPACKGVQSRVPTQMVAARLRSSREFPKIDLATAVWRNPAARDEFLLRRRALLPHAYGCVHVSAAKLTARAIRLDDPEP